MGDKALYNSTFFVALLISYEFPNTLSMKWDDKVLNEYDITAPTE